MKDESSGTLARPLDGKRLEIPPPDLDALVHQLIERRAALTPEMVALELELPGSDGRSRYTYAELNRESNQLATYLLSQGVAAGALVGVYFDACPELIVSILALLKLGAAFVPLEPSYPAGRLADMLSDARPRCVLSCERLASSVAALTREVIQVDAARAIALGLSGENPSARVESSSLAYVIFTSGSTGRPKGVMIEHAGLTSNIQSGIAAVQAGPGTRQLQFASIGFDLSVWEIFVCLCSGGTLCLPNERGTALTARLGEVLRRFRINSVFLPPSVLRLLDPRELPDVREVAAGGEAVAPDLVARWAERRFLNLYGPTEVSVICVAARCLGNGAKPAIGFPFPNHQAHVLDPTSMQRLSDGEVGELCISGPGVARGYLDREALTLESFVVEPWSGRGERMYRTGDQARRLPDGTLEFMGRLDDQIKLNGQRFELGEIESVLREHPAVIDAAAVVQRESSVKQRLLAFAVVERAVSERELDSHLRWRLPSIMVPESIQFLSTLPLNAHGKLDRSALITARAQVVENAIMPQAYTEREAQIAALWCQVLQVDQLKGSDDVLRGGVDSLLAIRLVEQMRRRLGLELPLDEFLRRPSLQGAFEAVREVTDDVIEPLPSPEPEAAYQEFPLTPLQRAYALGQVPGTPLGQIPTIAVVEYEREPMLRARLEAALRQLVHRHAMLRTVRTSFEAQRALPEASPMTVPEHDLRELDEPAQNQRLSELRRAAATSDWDAFRLPRFGLELIQMNGACRLLLRFDFSLLDYWSAQRMMQELILLYQWPERSLAPVALTFRDHVLARQAGQSNQRYRRAERYWLERVATLPPGPALPSAARPVDVAGEAYLGAFVRHRAQLEAPLWQALRRQGLRHGLTPASTLIAAFVEVLSLWADSESFSINVPVFDPRSFDRDAENVLGDFTSIELLEVSDPYGGTFSDRAQRLLMQLWRDFEHRQFDGVDVLRELNRVQQRPLGATMPIVFTSLLEPGQDVARPIGRQAWGHSSTPQVCLDCHVREEDGALHFNWDVVEALFPVGFIGDMFGAFGRLLRALAEPEPWLAPHRQLGLALLPEEQARSLEQYNDTYTARAEGRLHGPMLYWAEHDPERRALVGAQGGYSYAELREQATRLALELVARGSVPGAITAVCLPRCREQVVAVCAVLLAGGVYMPLSPALPRIRLRRLLADAGVARVLGGPCTAADALGSNSGIEWIDVYACPQRERRPLPPAGQPAAGELAYVIHTSGSTGTPSGVMTSHAAALNTIVDVNRRFDCGHEDCVLCVSELNFDLSVWDIFGMLAAGGAIVMPDESRKRDPEHWLELMHQHRVTVWNSVPALLELLVEFVEGTRRLLPSSLRLVLVSGDWISTRLRARVAALCPAARFISLGGATEAAIWSIFHEATPASDALPSVPYGRPLGNQSVHVLGRSLAPCPVYVPGELYIGGASVALGYLADPERTERSFVPHPATGERLYRTGDFGRHMPGGYVEFLGRRDHQVKVRGHRIELGEIEASLQRLPQVKAAAVVAIGARQRSSRLAAFVVPDPQLSASARLALELRQALALTLPDYMVPQVIEITEALPLTRVGKIDRQLLVSRASALAIPREAPEGKAEGARQRLIEGVWKEVLRVEHVGSHESFFELGGDSLLAIQVVTRIRRLGLSISVGTLYQFPTIAGMATACGTGADDAVAGDLPPIGELPIVPGQAWFLEQGLLDAHLWHEGHVLEIRGHLDVELLRRAFNLIVTHHHALRSRFQKGRQWGQHIVDDESHELLSSVAASELSDAAGKDVVEGVARQLQAELSLEKGPLLRAALIVRDRSEQLVLVGHHLVLDGFSWRIVLEDIQTLYRQLQVGTGAAPQQTHGFRSWAFALAERAAQLDSASELSFWSSVTRAPYCRLPVHAARCPDAESVQSVYAALDAEGTTRVQAVAGRAGLLAVLLSAWVGTARELGTSGTILVDLLSHGRAERSLPLSVGRTVGRFSTVYPVRVESCDHAAGRGLLAATREALDVTSERGFDFGLLSYLSPSARVQADMRSLPKPEVCFNYAGQFDQSLLDDSPFCALNEIPRQSSLRMIGERRYALEINCGIMAGRLQFEWRFSANVLQPAAVAAWSERLLTHLERMVRELSSDDHGLPLGPPVNAETNQEERVRVLQSNP